MKPLFVTGIGTEIGKTVTSAVLVEALKADYWKPIQSGDLHHTDSDKIREWAPNHQAIHPEGFRLNTPMSPHESARIDGVEIQISDFQLPATEDRLIVEGAGGLLVPINETNLLAELIPVLDMEVILVIRHYLGSINHSLLSIEYLKSIDAQVKGLIFNGEPVESSERFILNHSPWPLLGRVNEATQVDAAFIQSQSKNFTNL